MGRMLLVFLLGFGAMARAQEGTSQVANDEIVSQVQKRNWSLSVGVSTETNLRSADSADRSLGNTYSLQPKWNFHPNWSVGLAAEFSHDLIQAAESDFENSTLSVSHKPFPLFGEKLTLTPAGLLVLPTQRIAREEKSLRGGVGVSGALTADLSPFALTYGLTLSRSVHEFDRDNTGALNVAYRAINGLSGTYSFKKLSAGVVGKVTSGLTYEGTPRSSFELTEEISYAVSALMSVSVGHTNGGSTLHSDMQTSNVDMFNENTSTLYLGVEAVY